MLVNLDFSAGVPPVCGKAPFDGQDCRRWGGPAWRVALASRPGCERPLLMRRHPRQQPVGSDRCSMCRRVSGDKTQHIARVQHPRAYLQLLFNSILRWQRHHHTNIHTCLISCLFLCLFKPNYVFNASLPWPPRLRKTEP